MAKQYPTVERIRELLHYDPNTGLFTWAKTGNPAGHVNDKGYACIRLQGHDYKAHRLAWLYMTGEWPAHEVDHENRVRSDNRWSNLRSATSHQNKGNMLPSKPSASGFKGVYWAKHVQRWRAEIKIRGRKKVLGYFDDPALASELRELAGRMIWGDFYLEQGVNCTA